MKQGQPCPEQVVQRIIQLLKDTDLNIADIASRMDCSRGLIASINRRYRIRFYNGNRTTWETVPAARRKITQTRT